MLLADKGLEKERGLSRPRLCLKTPYSRWLQQLTAVSHSSGSSGSPRSRCQLTLIYLIRALLLACTQWPPHGVAFTWPFSPGSFFFRGIPGPISTQPLWGLRVQQMSFKGTQHLVDARGLPGVPDKSRTKSCARTKGPSRD